MNLSQHTPQEILEAIQELAEIEKYEREKKKKKKQKIFLGEYKGIPIEIVTRPV